MRARLFAALGLSLMVVACGRASSSISLTSPTSPKCEVSVANSLSAAAPSAGMEGTLSVTTARDCTWSAATTSDWINLTAAKNGQGDGSIAYRITANPNPAQRRATIDVNNTQVLLLQDAAPCRFTVAPLNTTVSASGGAVSINIDTLTGCSWSAASDSPWIIIPPNATGTRAGAITVTVAVNAGAARVGKVTIGEVTATIEQSAVPPPTPVPPQPTPNPPTPTPTPDPPPPTPTPTPTPCGFTIEPANANAASSGATGSATVTTAPGCAWTVVPHDSWLTVTAGASGAGNGAVSYAVAANSGAARTGTLTIAGKTFTVSQAAAATPPPPCTYSIAPSDQSVAETGGSGSFAVSASAGTCAWTAASNASWITMTSGSSGAGNGSVSFTVAANSGAARNGTITAAGKTFTVSQAAALPPPPPCTFSISPTDQSVADAGGSGSFGVTASPSTCAWTAGSNTTWITISTGVSGTGNGSVGFSVAANTGSARTGTITAAGQTFTVSQAAAPPPPPPPPPPCTYTLDRTSQSIGATGGAASVAVTATGSSCTWTASSNAPWISITSGASGSGNGSVGFSVAANTGAARSGTITIAGQTFTVSQDATP